MIHDLVDCNVVPFLAEITHKMRQSCLLFLSNLFSIIKFPALEDLGTNRSKVLKTN